MSKLAYAVLLDDVTGYRESTLFYESGYSEQNFDHKLFPKGSLLMRLNHTEVIAIQEAYNCTVNYQIYSVPTVNCYVRVGSHQALQISSQQKDFLLAVESLSERLEVYQRIKWIESLNTGSEVFVTIPSLPTPAKGIVRYIGVLAGEHGKKFGIELLENKEEGYSNGKYKGQRHFTCESDCAVFVAMDKLTDSNTASAAKLVPTNYESAPKGGPEIKMGDFVTFFDDNNKSLKGTVRWIGSAEKEIPGDTKIVGIETEWKIATTIPHHISKLKDYFTATEQWHSKIFLPITFVQKYVEPYKPVNSTDSATTDEVNKNDEHFEEFSHDTDPDKSSDSESTNFHDCHNDPNSPSLVRRGNAAAQNLQVGSGVLYENCYGVIRWIGYLDQSEGQFAGLEMDETFHGECEDGVWLGKELYKCPNNRGIFVQLKNLTPDISRFKRKISPGGPVFSAKRSNIDDYNKLPKIVTGFGPGLTSLPSSSLVLNQNPHGLEVGNAIQYGEPAKCGVIKWIGKIPGHDKTLFAGVEMDEVVSGYTDGVWAGKQYFTSKSHRGKFVRLEELQPSRQCTTKGSKTQQELRFGSAVEFGTAPDVQYGTIVRFISDGKVALVDLGSGSSHSEVPVDLLRHDSRRTDLSHIKEEAHGKWSTETVRTVYSHFYKEIVESLPMNDPTFLGLLASQNLFVGHVKDIVTAHHMQAEKAALFLAKAITSHLKADIEPFRKFLLVMGDTNLDNPSLRELASRIVQSLNDHSHATQDQVKTLDGKPTVSASKQDHSIQQEFGAASAVQFGTDANVQYGIIKEITKDGKHAIVELESDGGCGEVPLHLLQHDSRFDDVKIKATDKSNGNAKSVNKACQQFEAGSLIQFDNPVQYGVFKKMETEGFAIIEVETGERIRIPVTEIQLDHRFLVDVNNIEGRTNPLEDELYVHGDMQPAVPPVSKFDGEKHRGIQGYKNSCYLDATMYGMFAFSDAFDILFLEEVTTNDEACHIQKMLKNKIVYPLRLNGVVAQEAVEAFRTHLAELQNMKGLVSEEKDPEEFLNLLFKHIVMADPFLTIRRPSGVDKEFFIQLFVEPDENEPNVNTQILLIKMFLEQDITFAKYPTRLLLQMPRYGKKYKAFQHIIPSLELDVSELCNTTGSCFMCNDAKGYICNECSNEAFLKHKMKLYFCAACSPLWHKNLHRQSHKHHVGSALDDDYDTGRLQLLSVLCIETSHYVCFTRITGSDKDEWVFFDSMAERRDDGYNLPKVINCTDELQNNVYSGNNRILSRKLPELARRFVEDAYLCVYVDHDGVMYQ